MKDKRTTNSTLLKQGIYGGLQRATVVLFGVLTTIILTHKAIEPAEMGVWSLFLVIAAFVEVMRHGLVKNSVLKHLNSHKDNRVEILSSSLVLNIFITVIIGVVLFLCKTLIVTYTKAPQLGDMINWNALALLALIPFSHFEWLMLATLNLKNLFWTYVVRQSVTLLLLVAVLFIDVKVSLNMLAVFYAAGIFCGAVCAAILNRHLLSFRFSFSIVWIKRLWQFGKYAFGTGISSLVFRSTDFFLVANLLSTVVVAQQGIASRIFNMADIPSQLIGDLLFPKSSSLAPDDKARIKFYYEKSVGTTLAIIFPAIFFVISFPELLILILAGEKYLGAVPYLRILMVVSVFLCFLKQFGTIIDSTGKPHINFYFTAFAAIVNVVFCYFFIRGFGFIGAGYGLIATHLVAFAGSQYILYRLYNIEFLNSFRYVFTFYAEITKTISVKLATW